MNNMGKIIKNNSLPSPISLLKQAWEIYKRNFKTLAILSLVVSFSSFISNDSSFLGGIIFESSLALYISIIIVVTAISFWGFVATLYTIKDEKNGVNITEALSKGLTKLVPNLWVLFLSVFIMLGGFFLFVVPGIIFWIWFSMSNFVLVTENVGGMSALLKSREYIRGYFWAVAGRLLFFLIITLISLWLPSYLFKLFHLPLYINSIYSGINSMIITPFYLIYGFLLYRRLKSIKGEIAVRTSAKSKTLFIICGALGVIILIFLIIMFLFFSAISASPTYI